MKKLGLLVFVFSVGLSLGYAQAPKLRCVVVGLDHDHVWNRLPTLVKNPGSELVAISDTYPDLIAKAKTKVPASVKFFSDYTEMLDQMKPDAVIVTTATNLRLAILRACAQRHVRYYFSEGRLASNTADMQEAARVASAADIKVMVNYPYLWSPPIREAVARLKAGELGQIEKMVVESGHMGPKDLGSSDEFMAWLYNPQVTPGGALSAFGTYGIHLALLLKGRPARVFAYTLNLKTDEQTQVPDDAVIVLEYPDSYAVLLASWDWPYGKNQAEVYGPKGSLLVMGDGILYQPARRRPLGIANANGSPVPIPPLPPEQMDGLDYFIDCIRNNKPIEAPSGVEITVGITEVIDAALESVRTGQAVSLKP
jgi:predicted dehydrogenase